MRSSILAFAVGIVSFTSSVVARPSTTAQPGCVSKCWDNSQYVSNCAGDQHCLCDDADFQNAMYQCLYSQCQTAQFGIALHHALGLCSDSDAPSTSSAPNLLRQGGDLKKRTGFLTGSATQSATYTRTSARATGSVLASAYQTYTTQRAYPTTTLSSVVSSSTSTTIVDPTAYSGFSTVSSSTVSSSVATATASAYSGSYLDGSSSWSGWGSNDRSQWDGQRYPPSQTGW